MQDSGVMTRIGSNATGATGAVGGANAGGGPTAGAVAGSLMTGLAGKMAQTIGSAFNLVGNDATDAWQGNANDPYEIAELVAELSQDVQGSPADAGELSRALHSFVQESATLFAARPESRSLTRLQDVIALASINGGPATYAVLTEKVNSATQSIMAEAA
jgi:hypothetical protein